METDTDPADSGARPHAGSAAGHCVVVAFDGSPAAGRAAAYAASLPRYPGDRLLVLAIAPRQLVTAFFPAEARRRREEEERCAERARRAVEQAPPVAGVVVEVVLRRGDPLAEVLRECERARPGHVVVGASPARWRKRSTMPARLEASKLWPVVVVP